MGERSAMAPVLWHCGGRPCWVLALLLAVAASAPSDVQSSFDDGVLDDIGVSEMEDPNTEGEMYHQGAEHMSSEDMQHASKVFDVLFPTDDADDLGESESSQVHSGKEKESLDEARKARSEATKEVLKAKGAAATKKAEEDLKKAERNVEKQKMNVVGKDEFKKEQEKKVEQKLEKAKEEERSARKKILSAKGLEATEEATKEMEKAKAKVEKDKKKAASLGVKEDSGSKSKSSKA